METKIWIVDKFMGHDLIYPQLEEAAQLLKQGETVAFPTETVYGLGADATSDEAVDKIFLAKGRPSDNPLIIHIGNKKKVEEIAVDIPTPARVLMNRFWPGPLTLVLKKKPGISEKVTAGLETVGIRMPSHPVALALLEAVDLPIAAPSANLSGKPSPTLAKHVLADLNGRISGIVDGGPTGVGVESTVLDCTEAIPVILRPGGITKEQIEEAIGPVNVDKALLASGQAPKSPGMKYTHYAPDAPLYIVEGSREFLQQKIDDLKAQGKRAGVLTTLENESFYRADVVLVCGTRHDLSTVAAHLYEVLRSFNEHHVDIILSESFPQEGVGQAVMNRLMKAAGHQVISEID
ncbi:L-threonylcarbamoyladenylate synthase [Bacillus songklensis]|uniref:Threonylcarbamoyl-AMP synthase n=1 Tax=Bacillus songklensis TaxID=1069116 RepID=A0ABV8BB90_9BACI